MFERFSMLLRQAVFVARLEAGKVGGESICSEHMLIGILSVHPELKSQLGIRIEPEQIRNSSARWHPRADSIPGVVELPMAEQLRAVFVRAKLIADRYHNDEIRTEYILLASLEERCHAAQLLTETGVVAEQINEHIASLDGNDRQPGATGAWARQLTRS